MASAHLVSLTKMKQEKMDEYYCGDKQRATPQNLQLFKAASEGNVQKLEEAIAQDANVNFLALADSSFGNSPASLHESVQIKERDISVDCTKILLDNGANTEMRTVVIRNTPLHQAATQGHVEVCRMLIEAGASLEARNCYGNTVLHSAISASHPSIVRLLLDSTNSDNTLDINAANNLGNSALHISASLSKNYLLSTMVSSADHSSPRKKSRLVKSNPPPKVKTNPHVEIIKMLLESTDRPIDINKINSNGYTALMCASQSGCLDIVTMLVNHGACIGTKAKGVKGRSGRTAAEIAHCSGNVEISTFLRQAAEEKNQN